MNGGTHPSSMRPIRARVKNGRLVVDQPTELPEGTVLNLVPDEGNDATDANRSVLHSELRRSMRAARNGRTRPASEIIASLRRRDEH